MVRRATIFGTCALMFLIINPGCIVKKRNTQTVPLKTTSVPVKAAYTPSNDSLITIAQMRKWMCCNHLLDSLSYLYRDSFQTENAAQRLAYQRSFISAQNTVCLQCGLTGGYNEYLWILKNAGAPRNKSVLDSVGLATY